jgi:hypothetical protein
MMITRFVIIVLLLGTFGCSATYIRATTTNNPLYQLEQNAQVDWSTEWVDANTLHLSNVWPYRSIFSLGYVASHAHLVYDSTDAVLHIQYYLSTIGPTTLFIPLTINAEPRKCNYRCSWDLTPNMNEEINSILRWSGASVISRRGGMLSESFPPQKPILLPP